VVVREIIRLLAPAARIIAFISEIQWSVVRVK